MKLGLIVAATENDVIGKDGGLPWERLKGDLPRFKDITSGEPPIMKGLVLGRKTYESAPRKMWTNEGRTPIVLTRQPKFEGEVLTARTMGEALAMATKQGFQETWLGGGASVYEEGLRRPDLQYLELTRVHREVMGDTYLPFIDWNQWQVVNEQQHKSGTHTFLSYERR